MFTISLLLIFSFILLSSEFVSLSNWSKHTSDNDQLIANVESDTRSLQQQQQTISNDAQRRQDVKFHYRSFQKSKIDFEMVKQILICYSCFIFALS